MENEILKDIEKIFAKYKFTNEQKLEVGESFLKAGELLVLDFLSKDMTESEKNNLENLLSEGSEESLKQIYILLDEKFGKDKILKVRNQVYDKLVADYIAHMNS